MSLTVVRITFKAIKVSRRMPKEAGDNGGLNSYRSPRDFGGKHSEALFTALVAGIATFLMPLAPLEPLELGPEVHAASLAAAPALGSALWRRDAHLRRRRGGRREGRQDDVPEDHAPEDAAGLCGRGGRLLLHRAAGRTAGRLWVKEGTRICAPRWLAVGATLGGDVRGHLLDDGESEERLLPTRRRPLRVVCGSAAGETAAGKVVDA